MEMILRSKLGLVRCSAVALIAFSVGFTASAQSVADAPQRIGPGPGHFSPDDAMGFVGFEAALGRASTVTGAPFTANFSQETTEAFADGNRVRRTTNGTLARDANGRTIRDLTLPAI